MSIIFMNIIQSIDVKSFFRFAGIEAKAECPICKFKIEIGFGKKK